MTPEKEPEDLGVKIGTADEVFWNDVKTKAEQSVLDNERSIVINTDIAALAMRKIAEEKEKLKSKKNS